MRSHTLLSHFSVLGSGERDYQNLNVIELIVALILFYAFITFVALFAEKRTKRGVKRGSKSNKPR